ncbi:RimK family protein [Acanthopleuribacter pedis]|nr:RimK family protein [Acanthopleuribacter pedis]
MLISDQAALLAPLLNDDAGVVVMDPYQYITQPPDLNGRRPRFFNLCGDLKYQSMGYYVSLLGEARGHRMVPSVATLRDVHQTPVPHVLGDELVQLIQSSLAPLRGETFELSVYFGRNPAKRYDRLSAHLYACFPMPLLRFYFRRKQDQWQLNAVSPLQLDALNEDHLGFLADAFRKFIVRKQVSAPPVQWRYDLAILVDPKEDQPPSDRAALAAFAEAARRLAIRPEFIEKKDYSRLNEFDGLFIRTTTYVNHYTYRFARRAALEGLVTIDDPDSILRCTNKVFLAELMHRHAVPTPKTWIVHRDNAKQLLAKTAYPLILKKPDSAFSQGVYRVDNEKQRNQCLTKLFKTSPLIIAQAYMPTEFDWRIGVLDRRPLYANKYYMVDAHWQIRQEDEAGRVFHGRDEAVPINWVPEAVLKTALKAANLIGDGFYGVDLKVVDGRVVLIEINDNPSIDLGVEDGVLGEDLYRQFMATMLHRIEERKKAS